MAEVLTSDPIPQDQRPPAEPPPPEGPPPPSEHSLYVYDLDPQVTDDDLKAAFRSICPVASVGVGRDHCSGESLRHAYVNFYSHSDASEAMACLNHTELRGKTMRIMWSQRGPVVRELGVANALVKKSERISPHDEPQFKNLYVKNLEEDVNEDLLQNLFSLCGKVSGVVIMKNDKGKSRGFGFVAFESEEDAKEAVYNMNGALLGSKLMSVGRAEKEAEREMLLKSKHEMPNSEFEKLGSSNLYVKNLPDYVDESKLQQNFSAFGKIVYVKVMRHGNRMSKGFGCVRFSTPEEADKALKTLTGTICEWKDLYVAVAQRKEDRCKALEDNYAHKLPPNCTALHPFPPYPVQHPVCLSPPLSPLQHPQITSPHLDPTFLPQNYLNHSSSWVPSRPAQLGSTTTVNENLQKSKIMLSLCGESSLGLKRKQLVEESVPIKKTKIGTPIKKIHGTTNLAVVLKKGIVIGVDSRSMRNENKISSDRSRKIYEFQHNIIITRAGYQSVTQDVWTCLLKCVIKFPHCHFTPTQVADMGLKAMGRIDEEYSGVCLVAGVESKDPKLYQLTYEYKNELDFQSNPPDRYPKRSKTQIHTYVGIGSGGPTAVNVFKQAWDDTLRMRKKDACREVAYAMLRAALADPNSGGIVTVSYVSSNRIRHYCQMSVIELYVEFFPRFSLINFKTLFIVYKRNEVKENSLGVWLESNRVADRGHPLNKVRGGYYIRRLVFHTGELANEMLNGAQTEDLLVEPPPFTQRHGLKYCEIDNIIPGQPRGRIYIGASSLEFLTSMLPGQPEEVALLV